MIPKISLRKGKQPGCMYPSKAGVADFSQNMAVNLFPIIEGGGCQPFNRRKLRACLISLLEPISDRFSDSPEQITDAFFKDLPAIKEET